ncbi:NAD(P)H-dependent 6'-deoxychalcone synthase [Spatholobus suberectus]|nr:NAD(P)H-dependent 6'-deoxychalcone synthase [Spatholobus suberectus]
MSSSKVPHVALQSSSNHRNMPVIGLGTASASSTDVTKVAVMVLNCGCGRCCGFIEIPNIAGNCGKMRLMRPQLRSRCGCENTSENAVNAAAIAVVIRSLELEYLDLYLIHWPIAVKPGDWKLPYPEEALTSFDLKGVWKAMEECQKLGLTKCIGVSNFSCKKLENLLSFATIPPSVNQVEMNPTWQQKKLREYCQAKGIIITAYSPLGAAGTMWGSNNVVDNELLKEIAEAHGKSFAQVSLRWLYELGVTVAVKSYNKERMKQNLEIFDWSLTKDDYEKIDQQNMSSSIVPHVVLQSSSNHRNMPVIGLGTASASSTDVTKVAVLEAIKLGYRHFDTASKYGSEQPLGEAIAEALQLGLIGSRDELFITSKLWCTDNFPHLVLPALQKTLQSLKLEYLDLYLIHWPIAVKPGDWKLLYPEEALTSFDLKGVWKAMEECQKLGLTKCIGVSNFSCKKLENLLSFATIPPSVNQVEMNPTWQQKKLREYCQAKGIIITAYSPLGAAGTMWGSNNVVDNELLKEIAEAHGKSFAQVSLRWLYELGVTVAVKSYNKERMKQNLEIFDWSLTKDDYEKIDQVKQHQSTKNGPAKFIADLWDGEN